MNDRVPLYPTIRASLIAIYAIQEWKRAKTLDGGYYAVGFFKNRASTWETSIKRENRRVSLRLAKLPCIVCDEELSPNSTGDHIIPLSQKGPAGATNYLPLCKSHNSSKGARDLFEWWQKIGKEAHEMTADVLCCYARLYYAWCDERHLLDCPAPEALRVGLINIIEKMPHDCRLYWFAHLGGQKLPI